MLTDPLAPDAPYLLFVDDSEDDADIAHWRLARAGIAVRHARVCSRQELIAELNEHRPDLVVSDFSMPGFDGWGALSIAQTLAPDIPFIFHSGTIGEERCRIAHSRGAFGCVEKEAPADFVELVRRALMSGTA